MSGLIGKKIGMTSIFDENGKNVPCTVVEAGPCVVTQIRTIENDGYEQYSLHLMIRKKAIQLRQCRDILKKQILLQKEYLQSLQDLKKKNNLRKYLKLMCLQKENI